MITIHTQVKHFFTLIHYQELSCFSIRGLEVTYGQITIANKQTNSTPSAAHKDDHTMGDSKESSDPVDSSDSEPERPVLDTPVEWVTDEYQNDVKDTPEVAVLTGIKWV